MRDRKILITGATGQLLSEATEQLVEENEVWALARFTDEAARARLEAAGVHTFVWETGVTSLDGLPEDFTHVVHAAKTPFDDFATAIELTCVGVGQLMTHCRAARSFMFVSSTAVYTPIAPDHLHAEADPTGGYSPHAPAYAISKIAAEGTVRAYASTLGLPSVIVRMNIAYGPRGWGGLPLHYYSYVRNGQPVPVDVADGSMCMTPIHTDDITRQLPRMCEIATVPAIVVNWGGDEVVTQAELIRYMGEITGTAARVIQRDDARAPVAADPTRRRELIGDCTVGWRDGIARTVEAHFPGSVRGAGTGV